jgi:tetratricopeptide (TPR) repeat protein
MFSPIELQRRIFTAYQAVMADRECAAGRYADGERRVRLALRAAGLLRPADPRLFIRLLNTRGMIARYRGRFASARHSYARVMELLRSHPDRESLATLWHNLAGLGHAQGRHARAEVCARRGLVLRVTCVGDRHPDVGRDLAALAAILDGCGRHEEAEHMHRRALAIFMDRRAPEHGEIPYALANLAACLHALGRRSEAEAAAVRAVAAAIRVLGKSHPQTAITRENLEVIRATPARP